MPLAIDDIRAICDAITYKPGWVLTVQPVFGQSGLPGYLLQWQFLATDTVTGEENLPQGSRKWYVSRHAVKSEVVQTALAAVLAAEEHEAREWFRYDGAQPFKPHFDVDDLALLDRTGKVDVRDEVSA